MAINLTSWQGGKFRMADQLNALLNIDHKLYFEPFVGAGGLFFNKTDAGQRKVINDIDVGVYSLWKVLAGDGYQNFCNIFCNLDVSDITAVEACKTLGISRSSFYQRVRIYRTENL